MYTPGRKNGSKHNRLSPIMSNMMEIKTDKKFKGAK